MYHTYQLPFTFNTERLGYPVPENVICMTPNIPRTKSRGSLWLLSKNPDIKPAIDFGYFTDADGYDEQTMKGEPCVVYYAQRDIEEDEELFENYAYETDPTLVELFPWLLE
jgi:hypothetical protein